MDVLALEHQNDCGVNDLLVREMASPADCTCGAVVRQYVSVLREIEEAIYAAGAPLGSEAYFKIRAIIRNAAPNL